MHMLKSYNDIYILCHNRIPIYCHVNVYVHNAYITICHKTFDLLKMNDTFWGGVE